jgi:cytochrome P450
MVSSGRSEKQHEIEPAKKRHDLFSQLLHAHDENNALSEEELIGKWTLPLSGGLIYMDH